MAAVLSHPDTVSGTTILDDGTRVYWTEKSGPVAVRWPDGRLDQDMGSATSIFIDRQLENVDRDLKAVRGPMNHLQLQEWNYMVRCRLIPPIPLDSPELQGGPYTDDQYQEGRIDMRDGALLYGCVFYVERFTGNPGGVMGVCRRLPTVKAEGQLTQFGETMPAFASRDEAVAFLKEKGFYGRVVQYACDPRFLRGETESRTLIGGMPPVTRPCEPWNYHGVTDIVNIPPEMGDDAYHGHLLDPSTPDMHYATPADTIPF